jgi:hypothetical protein
MNLYHFYTRNCTMTHLQTVRESITISEKFRVFSLMVIEAPIGKKATGGWSWQQRKAA